MFIKEARKEKGYTQGQLANIIGVTQQAVQQYESGQRKPSVQIAIKLGEALGFEWTRFFDEAV